MKSKDRVTVEISIPTVLFNIIVQDANDLQIKPHEHLINLLRAGSASYTIYNDIIGKKNSPS